MNNDEYLLENIGLDGNEEIIKKYSSLNKPFPYSTSGYFKRLLVIWAYNFVKISNYISLKPQFFGYLPKYLRSKYYFEDLKYVWYDKNYKNKKYLPLVLAGFAANKIYLFYVILANICLSFTDVFRVSLFREIMSRFSGNTSYGIYKIFSQTHLVFFYIFNRIFRTLCCRKSGEFSNILRFRVTSQFQCLIFEKLLRISPSSTGERANNGQIFNFIQVDSYKLNNLMNLTPNLFFVPFQIFIYSFMLFNLLGWIFFIGIIILISFISTNLFFQKKIKILSKENMKFKDKRMKITSETFNNIKILKLYSWENGFKAKINKAREEELINRQKNYGIENLNSMIQWSGPIFTSLISIGLYQYFNEKFKIEDIFTILNLFNKIQGPLKYLPNLVNHFYETVISTERIEKFLKQEEINPNNIIKDYSDKKIKIKIENGSYSWGMPQGDDEKDDKNDKEKISKKNVKNSKKFDKIYQEIELVEKIYIPEENDSNKKKKKKMKNKNKDDKYIELGKNETIDDNGNTEDDDDDNTISIVNNTLVPVLKDINFVVNKGEFVCIIGEVGSGKSSLLQSFLNCLIPLTEYSKIYVNDVVAYVSQIPWIQNKTIKDNILFFKKYDQKKYNNILEMTCLEPDLKILEGGDLTEIGEKGVNLSGGQKSRIALARALYSDKEIYILDDPISALDMDVGMKIMKNCILGLLKDKTVILATHALQYLQYSDKIIYMKEGEIKWAGNYEEIKTKDFYISFFDKMFKQQQKKNLEIEESKEEKIKNGDANHLLNKGHIKRITSDEKIEKKFNFSIVFSFIKNMGGFKIALLITCFTFTINTFKMLSDIWLGYWAKNQEKSDKLRYFFIYTILCIGGFTFNYCLLNSRVKASITLSKIVHTLMIDSLISAPVSSYHETVPKGQIFNRLTKDINSVDSGLVRLMNTLISDLISFISAVSLCSYYEPYCLILCPILFYLGSLWTKFNVKCFREIYRIEGIVRGPILNIINETIPGTIIIRAFEYEKEQIERFFINIDEHFKARMVLSGINNLYDLILDGLSTILVSSILIFCLIYKDSFGATQIGLLLINYETIHTNMIRGLHTLKELQNALVEYERCMELTECPQEKQIINPLDEKFSKKIDKNWLKFGKIEFKNFSVRYREDTELVLKNINILINPGEKIGIVGRTGSGKSTITLCLFRLLEAFEGKIYIDDLDISSIPLEILRNNITIIPQDPLLIEGTLKFNIDPFNNYTDDKIIEVLKKINFEYIVNKNPLGLEQIIAEEGSNLSVGEKQLICIVRAILRNSKIIIMDEATASIDFKTEEIIQNNINEILKESTIITIAHRIKTILNYDKIISLDNGEVIEYDTPKNLLKNTDGIFYNLYYKSNLK